MTVDLEPAGVAQLVADAFLVEDTATVWEHLTSDVRLLLVTEVAKHTARLNGVRFSSLMRAMAVDVADVGPPHASWPSVAQAITLLDLASVPTVQAVTRAADGSMSDVAFAHVGPDTWRMERRGGRWRVANFYTEAIDTSDLRREHRERLADDLELRDLVMAARSN